jgi:hypothetical protein
VAERANAKDEHAPLDEPESIGHRPRRRSHVDVSVGQLEIALQTLQVGPLTFVCEYVERRLKDLPMGSRPPVSLLEVRMAGGVHQPIVSDARTTESSIRIEDLLATRAVPRRGAAQT